ncbi:hypothetical protein INT43_001272 [Umbelopsis isabellina]|uniref:VOC domain-containing protein n=1 Tax=Mortierella isabellina TaxID=91625 RepID=A0A8H7UAE7_MORIS|nr:hypothetical protein INT43_001272 [Umbelopsis isabellina]
MAKPSSLFNHIALYVKDIHVSRKFYDPVLTELGMELTHDFGEYGYFGYTQKAGGQGAEFGFANGNGKEGKCHVAFNADSKDTVKKYYDNAIAAGGQDNGGPGLRTQYGPSYYAAFVLDPDGNNIEFCYMGSD